MVFKKNVAFYTFLSTFLFCSCGVSIDSSTLSGGSSNTDSGSSSDSHVVTETTFNDVIKNYGCFINTNVTYNIDVDITDFVIGGYVLEVDGDKQKITKVDINGYVYATEYIKERTIDGKRYRDFYWKDGTAQDAEWERNTTEVDSNYLYYTLETGIAFNILDFKDFNYDSGTHKYNLKEAKSHTYDSSTTFTYSTFSIEFDNNKLIGIKATFNYGDGNNFPFSLTTTNFGETSVTLPLVWEEIDYASFKQTFTSKENCPWNHFEGTYYNPGMTELETIVEDLIDNNWTVDATKSGEHIDESSNVYIFTQEKVNSYDNLPTDTTLKVEKKGDSFKLTVNRPNNSGSIIILDKYFYCTDITETGDWGSISLESHVTWSTK